MALSTPQDLPPCEICGATAPFFINGRELCLDHWRQTSHFFWLTQQRMDAMNADE